MAVSCQAHLHGFACRLHTALQGLLHCSLVKDVCVCDHEQQRHTFCHSCNSSSSEGLVLLRCTAGSGSAAEGAAVDDSERCKLSVLAVVLAWSASRDDSVAQALKLLPANAA